MAKYKSYFCLDDELFHVAGKTCALSNQWGTYTMEVIEHLQKTIPSVEIQMETAKK